MSNILETRNLRHDFNGLEVIRGVDLQIAEGERHAIIGYFVAVYAVGFLGVGSLSWRRHG